jgi:TetR/AcrR family transcriptional regulator, transcriptional repressor of bet genes
MPRRYSMDTRAQATATTHNRLLDATVQALDDVSVDALTMQMVAERADVALRTLYNHFPSKEALVVEAYTRLAGRTQDAVRGLPTTGTPRERLAAFVEAFLDALERERPGSAVILGITGIPEFDAKLVEVRTWRRYELTKILRAAQREGSLRIALKPALALAFHLTAFVTWRSFVEESDLSPSAAKALARDTLDAVLFGARQSTMAG